MLTFINIKSLFGRFNYEIKFNDKGVNIITGPNGYGKTTILRIINSIAKQRWDFFYKLDFKTICIGTDDGEIEIKKLKDAIKINNVKISIYTDAKREDFDEYVENTPFFYREDDNIIYDRRSDRRYSYWDLYYKYMRFGSLRPIGIGRFNDEDETEKKELEKISKILGEVKFISAHRLYAKNFDKYERRKVASVIESLPERLKDMISQVSNDYAIKANSLDSSYPNRLLDAKQGISGEDEYQSLLKESNDKFTKLKEYRLANLDIIKKSEYNENFSTALKIYFDDFSEKYAVFSALIKKLDLFKEIINNRFTYKNVRITKEKGFEIIDNKDSTKTIELNSLSSGEQQEIVLFFELIFTTESNYILLIDEPEISLHILWQKMFLDDLMKIVEGNDINIVVATHSPQIINNHWEIQYDLGEIYGK